MLWSGAGYLGSKSARDVVAHLAEGRGRSSASQAGADDDDVVFAAVGR